MAGRGGDGRLRPHQAPLLHDPPADQPDAHRAGRARAGPRALKRAEALTLGTLAAAQFLAVMSASVVSVALPRIGADLRASATQLEWIVDAFVLIVASGLVAGGVLADRRGRKGGFLIGLGLFAAGSAIAAVAPSPGWVIVGRIVQGLGPAVVIPSSLALLSATFPDPARRAVAIGIWSTGSGLALALGPLIGGLVVDGVGWRWVFALNVPLALGFIALGAALLPRVERFSSGEPFDVVGGVLVTGLMGGLAFGIVESSARGWTDGLVLAALVGASVTLVLFVAWELRRAEPLVDVRLFRVAAFTAANLAGLVVFFAFIGAIVYFSVFFQRVQGRDATSAGLCLLPLGAGVVAGAPVAGRLVGRVGARLPMVGGLILAGAATLGLLRLHVGSSSLGLAWDFALVGLGAGLCLPPMTATALAAVVPERAGMASAIHNAMRQLGQVLGVAVLGSLVFGGGGGAGSGAGRLAAGPAKAYVHGLRQGLGVAGAALLLTAVIALVALPGRANH